MPTKVFKRPCATRRLMDQNSENLSNQYLRVFRSGASLLKEVQGSGFPFWGLSLRNFL